MKPANYLFACKSQKWPNGLFSCFGRILAIALLTIGYLCNCFAYEVSNGSINCYSQESLSSVSIADWASAKIYDSKISVQNGPLASSVKVWKKNTHNNNYTDVRSLSIATNADGGFDISGTMPSYENSVYKIEVKILLDSGGGGWRS